MNNLPKAKIGIVAVSRDCFPEELSVNRRKALVAAYRAKYGRRTFMNVLSALWRVKSIWCKR